MRYITLLVILLSLPLVFATPHTQYNSFSSVEGRLSLDDSSLSFVDDAVYRTAYYSINGDYWVPFLLSGTSYTGSTTWLIGADTHTLPSALLGSGEHYLLIYSCSRTGASWDCHGNTQNPDGFWQLHVINNSVPVVLENCSDNLLNNEEDFTDCGGPNCAACECTETIAISCFIDNGVGSQTLFCEDGRNGSLSECVAVNCDMGYTIEDGVCVLNSPSTCPDEEYYFEEGDACLLSVPGNTYFISLTGDDSNPGTFSEPFYSWQKGALTAQPGDIVYIRGGVWQPPATIYPGDAAIGILVRPRAGMGASGTATLPIRYYNYPGERPILDGILAWPNQFGYIAGLAFDTVEHIHVKGLTVRNIYQRPPDFSRSNTHARASGISASGANFYFENVVVHDIQGRAFEYESHSWDGADAPYPTDNSTWLNCDTYNLFDKYSSSPGNHADGWKLGTYSTGTFTWKGCRAWNYSDDGFDPHGSGLRIFEDSWAIGTDYYQNLNDGSPVWEAYLTELGITDPTARESFTQNWQMEGNGFKTTGLHIEAFPDYEQGGEPNVIFKRTIAAGGIGNGYFNNLYATFEDVWPNNALFYDTMAYHFGVGYVDKNASTFYNNIVYDSTKIRSGQKDEVFIPIIGFDFASSDPPPEMFIGSNNTWLSATGSSIHYRYNPAYDVTDEDFVSLDINELIAPRKSDGSLPDVNFGHLREGSELIDTGMLIAGYHCATNGSHPSLDCVEWYGLAPDLGPFEYKE